MRLSPASPGRMLLVLGCGIPEALVPALGDVNRTMMEYHKVTRTYTGHFVLADMGLEGWNAGNLPFKSHW